MEHLRAKFGNKLSLEGNPSYYDYIHSIKLFFDSDKSGSFELIDGGGQTITGASLAMLEPQGKAGKYKGDFTIENNVLNFNFKEKINIYYNSITPIYLVKQIEFNIIEEDKEHFNGYCKYISEYTIQLNSSPFDFDELKHDRKLSLYNIMNDNQFTLTFYTGLIQIPCDVIYERNSRNYKRIHN